MRSVETIIIGGGQAGLATSYYLKEKAIEHIILEKSNRIADQWRNERWDSFTLVTPNWILYRMPGTRGNRMDKDGFTPRDKIAEFFEEYVKKFELPVQYNTEAISVEIVDQNGFLVQTNRDTFKAGNVIIATGFFQQPKIPSFANQFSPEILQIHSGRYRNPHSLPEGAILVVGSGQSGAQIAEELYKKGRKVFLCVGTAGRVPRRYRGRDIIEWLELAGAFDLTPEQLPPGLGKYTGIPHFSGTDGGHTINLHQFAHDGVTLLGHLKGAKEYKTMIAPDLHNNLAFVDQFELEVIKIIDDYIQENNIDADFEQLPKLRDGYSQRIIEELDLKKEKINTIIWACGYRFDYSIIKLPVFDADGFPIQKGGITDYAGLYFAGIPWMPSERTGNLIGIAESAERLAAHIEEKKHASVTGIN